MLSAFSSGEDGSKVKHYYMRAKDCYCTSCTDAIGKISVEERNLLLDSNLRYLDLFEVS